MSSIWHRSYMTVFVGTLYHCIGPPANLPKIQTDVSDLHVNTHKAVPTPLLLYFPARALHKQGESKLHVFARWFDARHIFFSSRRFSDWLCSRAQQEWLRSKKRVRRPLCLNYVQFGEGTSDFAMIKIHTELVWTPTSPIRRWCPFGGCPEKSSCVRFLQKGPYLQAQKLNAIGEEDG